MICYVAKDPNGKLYPRTISERRWPMLNPGWSVVPVEIRELDEKRKRLEDAAEDLLAACKAAMPLLECHFRIGQQTTLNNIRLAIAKAEA